MNAQTEQTETAVQRPLDEILNEQLEARLNEIEAEARKLVRLSLVAGQTSLKDLTREEAYDRASDGHDLLQDAGERTRIAEGRASTAAALFASSPNTTNLAAKEIEAQRATNAKAKLKSIQVILAPLFTEEQRRLEVDELIKLREVGSAGIEPQVAAIVDLYSGFAAQLEELLTAMVVPIVERRKILSRLNDLERRHADGEQHSSIDIPNVRDLVVARLKERFSWDIAPGTVADSPHGAARFMIDTNRGGYPFVEALVRISPAAIKRL